MEVAGGRRVGERGKRETVFDPWCIPGLAHPVQDGPYWQGELGREQLERRAEVDQEVTLDRADGYPCAVDQGFQALLLDIQDGDKSSVLVRRAAQLIPFGPVVGCR